MLSAATDEQLITSPDVDAFGVFYARYVARVERYFVARTADREIAADLAAETFASAFGARRRFVAGPTPASGWLFTIAARRLVDFHRRTAVAQRNRQALQLEAGDAPPASDPGAPGLETQPGLLRHLPPEQQEAVAGHVIDEREYDELAARLGVSASLVRQRVSRGLRTLRAPLQVYREAQRVAREDHPYRLGGGHRGPLAGLRPQDPLDCSSAASLVLSRADSFHEPQAWRSARLAEDWGIAGEGRYVTVWAGDGHVWLEFRLESERAERFDPTPARLTSNSGWLTPGPHRSSDARPRHWPGW
jgi:RNA polymerase sigma factor (sigma-70 family)